MHATITYQGHRFGAEFIAFRCVPLDSTGQQTAGTLPARGLWLHNRRRRLSRPLSNVWVECSVPAWDRDGNAVTHVGAGDCGDDGCDPKMVDGDWVPVSETDANAVLCTRQGKANSCLRGE